MYLIRVLKKVHLPILFFLKLDLFYGLKPLLLLVFNDMLKFFKICFAYFFLTLRVLIKFSFTMILKTIKFIWRTFLGILIFFGLYFLFAFLLTIIPSNRGFQPVPDGVELFIISNGVHTDICFPIDQANLDWNNILDFTSFQTPIPQMKYLSIGWGDKGFYFDTPTWADLSAKTAATAAFIPSPTAMHISILRNTPTIGDKIRKTSVSSDQLLKMEQYILNHLELKNEHAQLIDCCRYDGFDDNFYEANGSYHLFRTCNTWANQVLKVGGIRTATWAPFDKCILYHFN